MSDAILTEEEVLEKRARAQAATPGPWDVGSTNVGHSGRPSLEYWVKVPALGRASVFLDHCPTEANPVWEWTHNQQDEAARADVSFMAASRTDIPALCASHEAIRDDRDRLAARVAVLEGALTSADLKQRDEALLLASLLRCEATP